VTREAVVDGFEHFIADVIEETASEFSVSRALRDGMRGPGGRTVDQLLKNSDTLWRRVVEPELDSYREQTVEQFEVILDYVESGEDIETYRDDILDAGSFSDAIRADLPAEQRQTVLDALVDHHQSLGEATRPLVESPESSFWDAARVELTEAKAHDLVEEQFAFTEPLRTHRDAFKLGTTIDTSNVFGGLLGALGGTFEVEYTTEAIRAMRRAEQTVIRDAKRELDREFDT